MKTALSIAVLVASMALFGCSEKKLVRTEAARSVKNGANEIKASTKAALIPSKRSVFTVDANLRDPFFPKVKKQLAASAPETTPPADVPTLLQSGFQGVVRAGGQYIALINNVMLEPGRAQSIPFRNSGREQTLKVRCREVLPNRVVLDVDGYPGAVTVTRIPKS